jgi:hypothetical protein
MTRICQRQPIHSEEIVRYLCRLLRDGQGKDFYGLSYILK